MLKKRLIFVLYYDAGAFHLSRNFRLQRVGDVGWLVDKFRFRSIGKYIDEIVIVDVSRNVEVERCNGEEFRRAVDYLMKETFVPLTIGGGIRSMADARRCLAMGADKLLFNSPVIHNPELIKECVASFGAQAVVGSIDVMLENGRHVSMIDNGQQFGMCLDEHLARLVALGVGEVMINSIKRDGTGMGFDLSMLAACQDLPIPLIVSGGAGKPEHFADVLAQQGVEAAATGNLFNFIGKGFEQLRAYLLERHFPIRDAANLTHAE